MRLLSLATAVMAIYGVTTDAVAGDVEHSSKSNEKKTVAIRLLRQIAFANGPGSSTWENDSRILLADTFALEEINEIVAAAKSRAPDECTDPESTNEGVKEEDHGSFFADRHARRISNIATDFDCLEREFDVTHEDYDEGEAADVLSKCRILVLRNVFPQEQFLRFRSFFEDFVGGLHQGKISSKGKTSRGEGHFLDETWEGKYELILPEYFLHDNSDFFTNQDVLDVLQDNRILGSNLVVHSLGGLLSEAGSPPGNWHSDDTYLFDDESLGTAGIGGQDLPAFAVTMIAPVLFNFTLDHGPTEFCIGSSHLTGIESLDFADQSLANDPVMKGLWEFYTGNDGCPPALRRIPLLQPGDVVLFDYQISHRGGHNTSPDMRSLMYATYSRRWYRDSNFDPPYETMSDYLLSSTRFALVNDPKTDCTSPPCDSLTGQIPLESIKNFLHRRRD